MAVARRVAGGRSEKPIGEVIASLSREQLLEIVSGAADRHDDVERAARLIVARSSGDLGVLRAEVDRGLRTRRFLGYRESMEWAQSARPVVEELELAARTAPSVELVELLQRAVGHVVKVIGHADDSSGQIGELVRDLLDLHALTCDAGVADPVKLARWMIRFQIEDQDFFEVDLVRYATALGDEGVAAYRAAVAADESMDSFALRHARERLAVLDGDIESIVDLVGGDLSNPHEFIRVAEAMAELGRDDLVLGWATRGIAETNGWQVGRLYDLACETHERLGEKLEVLRLRRAQHERMPSLSTYTALRDAAEALDTWRVELDAARAVLRRHDVRGFVDVLLHDGDAELAWKEAVAAASDELGRDQWLRLAESREADHPGDALAVYQRVTDEVLQETDRRAYAAAVRILKRARSAALAAGEHGAFTEHLARLREQYRRRPTLMAMLDKASLD
jgi:cell division septum initiation protein DivIVA